MRVEIVIGITRPVGRTSGLEIMPEVKITTNARTTVEAIDKAVRHLLTEKALIEDKNARPVIVDEDENEDED